MIASRRDATRYGRPILPEPYREAQRRALPPGPVAPATVRALAGTLPVWGEAPRRTARAQRAGFASWAEEERHSR